MRGWVKRWHKLHSLKSLENAIEFRFKNKHSDHFWLKQINLHCLQRIILFETNIFSGEVECIYYNKIPFAGKYVLTIVSKLTTNWCKCVEQYKHAGLVIKINTTHFNE
jgi:hypothetical protein